MSRTFRAARTLCHVKQWELSNLPLQKLLYISHMFFLGRYGTPLIDGTFQAWNLGPVEPTLYREVRAYGNAAIPDIFGSPLFEDGTDERKMINDVVEAVGGASAGKLVGITHWRSGAWAKYFRPDVRGIAIPNSAILQEYHDREEDARARANIKQPSGASA